MSDEFDRDYVKDVVDIAIDYIEDVMRYVRATGSGMPVGGKRAADGDMQALWDQKMVEYPPQPMILPTGESVFESPWVMCLQMAENGGEWLNRYKKMIRQEEEDVS